MRNGNPRLAIDLLGVIRAARPGYGQQAFAGFRWLSQEFFFLVVRHQARAMLKIAAILDGLAIPIQRDILRSLNRNYGGPLSAADRMMELRKRRNISDEENVTAVTENQSPTVTNRTKVSGSYELFPGFCSFWSLYPKRVGKGEAFKAWSKGNCESLSEVVVRAVREQNGYLIREGGQFTPLPATWLNQRRWEDEPPKQAELHPRTAANLEAARKFVERGKS